MANLPPFPSFNIHDSGDTSNSSSNSAGVRWRKWTEKLDNLICALDIDIDKRKKALLLHYCGEECFDIYDSFTDEQKGVGSTKTVQNENGDNIETPDEYGKLCSSFKNYFTPKQNLTYEIYKFRQSKQESGESIDTFYTRLRTLAATCEFHNKDTEILNQVIQGCTSTRIRRRALRDNFTLDRLIEEARALEVSEVRASDMEGRQAANANAIHTIPGGSRGRGVSSRGRGVSSRGRGVSSSGRSVSSRGRGSYNNPSQASRTGTDCRNCGGKHVDRKCPAFGKKCHHCGKLNHFQTVCRSRLQHVNYTEASTSEATQNSSSDESVFNLCCTNSSIPSVCVNIFNSDVKFLIDTGSSVNIMNENIYNNMSSKPSLQQPVPLIFAYGASQPLDVKGYFRTTINYKGKTVTADMYVVGNTDSRQSSCLLGAKTAQALDIVQFAFSSFAASSSIPDQYPSLFDGKMGKIEGISVKLHIDHDVPPVTQRHRRIPFHVRKDVEAELKRLEDLDVIEPISGPTPWVSPVVVVPKKSKGVRVCIDMREANKAISREKHPMPTVEELMSDLNSSTVFSKLDLSNAYHQLELDESSRYITTFVTHVGLRRYKRLLFGVNAASEIFQKTVADLLADIPGAKNLADDIIIHGKSQSDHDRALSLTLERLNRCGAKLNRDKCVFSVNKISFFGHVFSDTGVSADPEKIKAIVGHSAPQNPAEVRSFLGMTQYVSRYIPHYATMTEPLRRLTRQDVPWDWSSDAQNAFDSLRSALSSTKVMAYFDQNKSTEVLVDASPVGVGAILTQEGRVICYGSRALTDVEQRYSQTDREMLAVVYGVEHFHLYLFASEFKVITDHKPLLGLVNSRKPASARIERWRLRLMPYQFTLEYRPGKDDLNPADYMSRHPFTKPKRDNAAEAHVAFIVQKAVPKAMSLQEIQTATREDATLQKVMTAIQSGNWSHSDCTSFVRFRDEFSIVDGVILRDHRIVVPTSLQQHVVEIAHHTHQGMVKTKQLVREKVWFPGIDKMVEDAVRSCIPCQASYPGPNKREPICPTKLPSKPWEEVAVDFAGPFPSGQYLLVVMDEHSRFPEVEIVYSTAARVVVPRLKSIFARQGFPSVLKSDNGPPFQGQEFAEFASTCGFKHRRITPLWPEANGTVERFMATLNKFVRAAVAANRDWRDELHDFLMHYRATPHASTQISPFEALVGRKMSMGLPEISKPVYPVSVSTRLAINDANSKQKMKQYADSRRHTSPCTLIAGDQVLVKQRKVDKLTPPYNPDPYTVKERRGSMVIADRNGHTITRNSSHFRPVNASIPDPDPDPEGEPESIVECPVPQLPDLGSSQSDLSPTMTPVPLRRNPPRAAGMPKRLCDFELT
jgi:hypothetical protein